MTALPARLIYYRDRINAFLSEHLPSENAVPQQLHAAIRYVVLSGGKRIRAALIYATGETLGIELNTLDEIAAAVELIHAYSLVHDDLPAMDNDDLRRGKPTCHKAFNEAIAILTGDALQTLAFSHLVKAQKLLAADVCLKMMNELTTAIGTQGMVGGQALDLAAEGKDITLTELETIHAHKTGALIAASINLAVLASGITDEKQINNFAKLGKLLGIAFQIQDDILDIESSTDVLGKTQGADLQRNKATYPAILGMSTAKQKLHELQKQILQLLKETDISSTYLQSLVEFIIGRNY